jgi:hypothetical protein
MAKQALSVTSSLSRATMVARLLYVADVAGR